jgi:drug/metabolite transporter (DMT)-like permease
VEPAAKHHGILNTQSAPAPHGTRSPLNDVALIGLLLAVTAVWGWTFLIVKDAVATYPVADFLAFRFVIAAIVLLPFAFHISRRTLLVAVGIGTVCAMGYLCQTAGLTTTSAANAGLLTGLFVILTPIIDRLFYRAKLNRITIVAIVAGFAGTCLLTFSGGRAPTLGDLLEVLTAVAFAIQIVWLGHYARGHSSTHMAFGQMLPAAAIFVCLAGFTQGPDIRWPSAWVWFAILLTGIVASAIAFWAQTFVQQRMAPSRTALILLGEPAFATLFAVGVGGEALSASQWLGAAMIFGAMVAHEGWTLHRGSVISGGDPPLA